MVLAFNTFDYYMYRELNSDKRIITYYVNEPVNNKALNFLKRAHRSVKINQIVDLPGKGLWDNKLLEKIDKDTCVIFSTASIFLIGWSLLEKVKQKSAKTVLLIVDSMHANSWHLKLVEPQIFHFSWDLILSYDKNDCAEFGFHYLGNNYYSILNDVQPSMIESDIYYVGREKRNSDRNRSVIELQDYLVKNNVKCNFNLVDNVRNQGKYKDKKLEGLTISYQDLPYEKVISDVKSSNCILEMVQEGQSVQTVRYFEAICYNKKLLTNNFGIIKFPFYNDKYMKCFRSVEEIDLEWIRTKEDINYNYNNEFSSLKILDMINSHFNWFGEDTF